MIQLRHFRLLLTIGVASTCLSCAKDPNYYSKVSDVGEGGRGYTITRIPIEKPAVAPTAPLPPGDATVHETGVRKSQTQWMTALKEHSPFDLSDLMEDRFTLVGPDGSTLGKDEFVALVRDGRLVVQSEDIEESSVAEYGNAAIMNGIVKIQATNDGNDISGSYRFVDTWIWKSGKWKKASAVFLSIKE